MKAKCADQILQQKHTTRQSTCITHHSHCNMRALPWRIKKSPRRQFYELTSFPLPVVQIRNKEVVPVTAVSVTAVAVPPVRKHLMTVVCCWIPDADQFFGQVTSAWGGGHKKGQVTMNVHACVAGGFSLFIKQRINLEGSRLDWKQPIANNKASPLDHKNRDICFLCIYSSQHTFPLKPASL